MSELIERNRKYLIKSQYGSYHINNRKSAEQLQEVLTDYEHIKQQYTNTEKTLDNVTKKIIQLQLTVGIMQEELDQLHKELIQ